MDYREPIEPAIIVLAVCGALPLRRLAIETGSCIGRPVTLD